MNLTEYPLKLPLRKPVLFTCKLNMLI